MNWIDGDNGIPHGIGSLSITNTSSLGLVLSALSLLWYSLSSLSIFDLLTRFEVLFGEDPKVGELDFFCPLIVEESTEV